MSASASMGSFPRARARQEPLLEARRMANVVRSPSRSGKLASNVLNVRRWQAMRAQRTRRIVRLLSVFVLTVLLSHFTIAFAFPCVDRACAGQSCPEDDEAHDREREHDHEGCPCPIDCPAGCAGSALRAVAPAPLDLVLPSPMIAEITWLHADRAPPPMEPAEPFHVAKSGA